MEDRPEYRVKRSTANTTIADALVLVLRTLRDGTWSDTAAEAIEQYLSLRYGLDERQVYGVLLFDPDRRLIETVELAFDAAPSMRVLSKCVLLFDCRFVTVFTAYPNTQTPNNMVDQRRAVAIDEVLSNIDVSIISQLTIHGDEITKLKPVA